MTEQSPGDMSGRQPERKPLFDPYTGERLEPEAGAATEPETVANAGTSSELPAKRRRTRLVVGVAVLMLAVIGVGAWYVTGPMAQARAEERAKRVQAAEHRRQAACEHELEDSHDALTSIDSRLNVGMRESDYTAAVGEAQAAFDRVDEGVVAKNDCAAYDEIQSALEQYAKASTYWNDCIVEDYCTPSETKLNGYWSKATTSLANVADGGLGQSSTAGSGQNG